MSKQISMYLKASAEFINKIADIMETPTVPETNENPPPPAVSDAPAPLVLVPTPGMPGYLPPPPADVPPPPADVPPPPADVPPPPAIETDASGLPWDARIHALTKTKRKMVIGRHVKELI